MDFTGLARVGITLVADADLGDFHALGGSKGDGCVGIPAERAVGDVRCVWLAGIVACHNGAARDADILVCHILLDILISFGRRI